MGLNPGVLTIVIERAGYTIAEMADTFSWETPGM
jgi:hypothetical protein